ncbi:MAG: hypothetical protein DRI98_10655 [Bacteroidetes bacterium]|nr:MAG: hypothetical protein DRI98_10655 [Bacteroidota bacterium]
MRNKDPDYMSDVTKETDNPTRARSIVAEGILTKPYGGKKMKSKKPKKKKEIKTINDIRDAYKSKMKGK